MATKTTLDQAEKKTADNAQPGFGGMKQWEAIEKLGLAQSPTASDGNQLIPFADADKPSGLVGEKLGKLETSIEKLSEANASMLKGEIPADVSAAVRRSAAESSLAGGLFGGSSRALTARDLGRTSLDIRQRGIENEKAVVDARSGLANAYESLRQYNLSRNATLAELEIKAKQNNLTAIDLERQRIATNISANVDILGLIANMAVQQQSIAASAAANDVNPSNIISSLDRMIEQLNSKLT